MALTTYDEVWQCFLTNCKGTLQSIPQSDEVIYEYINNARVLYNIKIKSFQEDFTYPITCDNNKETLLVKLKDEELMILANYIKLVHLKNELTSFVSRFSVFQKELGIQNYNAQVKAKEYLIESQEETLRMMINDCRTTWEI
ncbi:hypothetical protein ACSW9O_16070 (plasmid) [Clostridium perfringens]